MLAGRGGLMPPTTTVTAPGAGALAGAGRLDAADDHQAQPSSRTGMRPGAATPGTLGTASRG